jgi:hypothetical protein
MINLKALFFNTNKTKLQITISDIKKLNVTKLSTVYSSDMSIYKLHTLCNNVSSYIFLLDKILNFLKEDKIVPVNTLPQFILTIYLSEFYLDNNNNYLNVQEISFKFKNLTIELLTLYDSLDRLNNRTFNQDKNLLYLNNIVNNLILIFLELKKCLK